MSKRKFWELENPDYKITYEVVKQNGRKYRIAKGRRRGLSAKYAFLAPLESADLSGLDFTDPALKWIWSQGEKGPKLSFADCDLTESNFAKRVPSSSSFPRPVHSQKGHRMEAYFKNCRLAGANLSITTIESLEDCVLNEADLRGALIKSTARCDFSEALFGEAPDASVKTLFRGVLQIAASEASIWGPRKFSLGWGKGFIEGVISLTQTFLNLICLEAGKAWR